MFRKNVLDHLWVMILVFISWFQDRITLHITEFFTLCLNKSDCWSCSIGIVNSRRTCVINGPINTTLLNCHNNTHGCAFSRNCCEFYINNNFRQIFVMSFLLSAIEMDLVSKSQIPYSQPQYYHSWYGIGTNGSITKLTKTIKIHYNKMEFHTLVCSACHHIWLPPAACHYFVCIIN